MTASPVTEDIAVVRAFNRFYTRRIGVLDEGHLGGALTLGECRVLFELAQEDGLTAKRLGVMLGLDGGYLSRILRRFEVSGLVRRRPDPRDGRSSTLHLTAAGQEAFAGVDARSEGQVAQMVSGLDGQSRAQLATAMRTVQVLLDPGAGQGRPQAELRDIRPGDIGWVIQRHAELYAQEQGWSDPRFEVLVAQVCVDFLRAHDPVRERCWIAERDGQRLGGVFVVDGGNGTARLRMLLVEPSGRGLGLGRRLVQACIGFAREAGYRELVLWTHSVLETARRIYADAGFTLAQSQAHEEFGVPVVGETWRLALDAKGPPPSA